MSPVKYSLSTPPAPLIAAHCTSHVWTSFIFFDWRLTFRTFVCSYIYSPTLIELLLRSFASNSFVPLGLALVANIFLALAAFNLFSIGRRLDDILAIWSWAKLFISWFTDFNIKLKPLVLFEHVFGQNLLYLLLWKLPVAFRVRALHSEDFACVNLVIEVFS